MESRMCALEYFVVYLYHLLNRPKQNLPARPSIRRILGEHTWVEPGAIMVSGSSTVVTTGYTVFTRNLAKYDGGMAIAQAYNDAAT